MERASRVLNRQLIPVRAALRSRTRAWTSLPSASSSGSRCFRQEAGQHAELDFRHIQPTPVLGGVMELQPFRNPSGLGRWEGLVPRRRAAGVQVVQDQPHHRDLRIGFIHQPAHLMGEVLHGAPLSHRHMRRHPASGSQARNRFRVPSRRYS